MKNKKVINCRRRHLFAKHQIKNKKKHDVH